MRSNQAKVSVETAKEVANDKTLRNKAEKERRLREKNQNNTKKFIEERKVAAMKQEKEKEKLRKLHEKQLEDLTKDIQNVSEVSTPPEEDAGSVPAPSSTTSASPALPLL